MAVTRSASATERAYESTKQRILDGSLNGGDIITEGQISASLGVSRTPVREAFLRLQADGLLQLYPKRGAVIAPITIDEAHAMMEARQLVETHAVTSLLTQSESVASRVISHLWDNVAAQRQGMNTNNIAAFVDADVKFHRIIVAAANNPVVEELYMNLRDRQHRMTIAALRCDPSRMQDSYGEHLLMLEELEDGELDTYLSRLRNHLRNSRDVAHRAVETLQPTESRTPS